MPYTGTLRISSPVDVFLDIGCQTVQGTSSPEAVAFHLCDSPTSREEPYLPGGGAQAWLEGWFANRALGDTWRHLSWLRELDR